MEDCKHEDLHYFTFQANTKNAEVPMFHTVRCKKCNQLIGVFPFEREIPLTTTLTKGIHEVVKVLGRIEIALSKK
jgi:hypothetical protein